MDTIDILLNKISTIVIYPIMVVVFAAGFFLFMWGLFQFMRTMSEGGGKNAESGKQHMLWGTIGMTIMVSGYGLVHLLDSTIGANSNNPSANADKLINSIRLH
jgi:hypothetical protein